ncbi:MAG: tRNA pseudouridine(38-40) synthase TruA [Euryarchaeota archaeon]|nr:tRNA pseudouridine(38-40) synthase TruA [Euryarchaeota archaeon]MDE1879619.1 tRNA pseudouridine(38-40) synthase TruA [Euryarchaeota archaeon]
MSAPKGTATWAFRIGYLADGFHGYARQPSAPTVEGTLLQGLLQRGVLSQSNAPRFRTASRTDRGVHALGNVVSFPTHLKGLAAARVIGSIDPRIFCFGYAEVESEFQPRHARSRWYRYLEPSEGHHLPRWREASSLFLGEHDFSSFSRRDDPPRSPLGRIDELEVRAEGSFFVLDLRAPSFLWNQVRKIVAALELLDAGRIRRSDIEEALRGRKVLHLPLARPQGLVLMEVSYDFPFTELRPRASAQRRDLLEGGLWEARSRETLLGWFQAKAVPPSRGTSDP